MWVLRGSLRESHVQPAGRRNDRERVSGNGVEYERLNHLTRRDPDRTGLVDGREGLRMADHLERHAVLLQVLGHDRHERPPAPNSTAQRSSTRTTADTKPM